MKGLRLIATGGALPGRTVTNEELDRKSTRLNSSHIL